MKQLWFYILLVSVICLGISRSVSAEDHAQASVIADVSAIQPGVPFTLGIQFQIDPGWHIYWKNPGDSGLATDVKLTLPDGFTASELMFPVPTRIELPGPIINYGYEKEVMLMIRVTPPKNLEAGKTTTIPVKVSWLVCNPNNCVPGSADESIDLPVAAAAGAANTDLFKKWSGQLPVTQDPANINSISNSMAITKGDGTGQISIRWAKLPTDIQYFPGPLVNGYVQNLKVDTTDLSSKITFDLKGFKGDEPVTGLLVFTSAAGVKTGIEISIPQAK